MNLRQALLDANADGLISVCPLERLLVDGAMVPISTGPKQGGWQLRDSTVLGLLQVI